MITNKNDDDCSDNFTRPCSSEQTIRCQWYNRRPWFDESTGSQRTITVPNDCTRSIESAARRLRRRSSVKRSRMTTDLIEANGVGEPCDTGDKDPDVKTGSVEAAGVVVGGGMVHERYGPHERAGTFEIVCPTFSNNGPEAKILMEFTVWRWTGTSRHRVLWFTARKEMPPSAAIAVRVLQVWTDRNNGYPLKVVFLQE